MSKLGHKLSVLKYFCTLSVYTVHSTLFGHRLNGQRFNWGVKRPNIKLQVKITLGFKDHTVFQIKVSWFYIDFIAIES